MKRQTVITFIVTEAVLYIVFVIMDLLSYSDPTIILKYAGVLLCLFFSVLSAFYGGDKIIPFALLLTVTADFFLLVIDSYYTAGVIFFLIAQIIYLLRLYTETGKIWIPVRIACFIAAVLILAVMDMFSLLNLAAVVYFSLLLINMIISRTLKSKRWRIFSFGLFLFVLCDICVGLYNLSGTVPVVLCDFSRIGMWIFYLPSQVLISLSCCTVHDEITL